MKITFIATVFNEEENIDNFLKSLSLQTKKPDQIVIVDGGSIDTTVFKIMNYESRIDTNFNFYIKKGNRSVGRNEAIRNATGDIIVCSDSGNILDKNWIKNIYKPFLNKNIDVVAGYYKARTENVFQECLIPYVFVMPDKINSRDFLPATRSVAFKKSVWKKAGGFNERLSHNEDYVFANKLKKINAKIFFEKNAFVYWIPRKNLKEAYFMFYRFAQGDIESGILRPKVVFIFVRYLVAFWMLICFLIFRSSFILSVLCLIIVMYIFWSIKKNYKYVKKWEALFILPGLQIVSDFAVMIGSLIGSIKLWDMQKKQ